MDPDFTRKPFHRVARKLGLTDTFVRKKKNLSPILNRKNEPERENSDIETEKTIILLTNEIEDYSFKMKLKTFKDSHLAKELQDSVAENIKENKYVFLVKN